MQHWLIVGASGGMGRAFARELGSRGYRLTLAAPERDHDLLETTAEDLRIRHAVEVHVADFEALEWDRHSAFLEGVEQQGGELHGVAWTVGVLWDQGEMQSDPEKARRHHDINYTSAASLLGLTANRFEARGRGHIVAWGSPAGDRGRRSNYLYGADKAALHTFMEGLRHRLADTPVHVMTVKPGPTDTPMTAGMEKLPFLAQPARIARDAARALDRRREVIYTPPVWWPIMHVIRHLPRAIYKKLDL